MSTVEIVVGLEAIAQLQPNWDALFARLPYRSHVQSHAWVMQHLSCLEDDGQQVQIALVHDSGVMQAIVPLRVSPLRLGPMTIARWSLLLHPHATISPVLLAPQVDAYQTIRCIINHFTRQNGRHGPRFDFLEMPSMLDDGTWGHGFESAGSRVLLGEVSPSFVFDTSSGDSALAATSSHFRKNLGQRRRKLEKLGSVTLDVGSEPSAAALREFFALEASGWKGEGGKASAIQLNPRLLRFYEGLADGLKGRQQVWIPILRLDGRAVASAFCVRTDSTLALLKNGYDETLRQAAPGNVLLAMLLEACGADPVISALSLVTAPKWAETWCPQRVNVYQFEIFAQTWRGLALYWLLRSKRAIARLRRRMAERHTPAQPTA